MTLTATDNVPVQLPASDLDPTRLLTIAANLLPAEITAARRTKKVQRIVAAALVLLMLGIAAWDANVRQQTSLALGDLNRANQRVLALQNSQKAYSALNQTKASAQAITDQLRTLMAEDLQWSELLPALRASSPAGVMLSNVGGALTPLAAGPVPFATNVPGSSPALAIGSITIVGTAPDKARIANFVDALGQVKGLANPYLNSAAVQSGGTLNFTIAVQITSAALGGRFTTPSSSASSTTEGH